MINLGKELLCGNLPPVDCKQRSTVVCFNTLTLVSLPPVNNIGRPSDLQTPRGQLMSVVVRRTNFTRGDIGFELELISPVLSPPPWILSRLPTLQSPPPIIVSVNQLVFSRLLPQKHPPTPGVSLSPAFNLPVLPLSLASITLSTTQRGMPSLVRCLFGRMQRHGSKRFHRSWRVR